MSTRLLCATLVAACGATVHAAVVTDPGQGPVTLPAGASGAVELSGISWAGGSSYLLVSDDSSAGAHGYSVTASVDPVSGEIVAEPVVDVGITFDVGEDLEGVAYDGYTALVCDEVGSEIHRFDPSTGSLIQTVTLPEIFTIGTRDNLGLESIAVGPDGSTWTANEEALTSDGGVSSFEEGTIVRVQRLAGDLTPAGQWGYVTDPISEDILGSTPGRDVERSGVVELAVLPDGTLLALERMLGGLPPTRFPVFRIRVYELDLEGADDTSALPALVLGEFTPVGKALLWEGTFDALTTPLNLEGMAVGPPLGGSEVSLLLVSDDAGQGGSAQSLYPLRVTVEWLFGDGFEAGDAGRWSETTSP